MRPTIEALGDDIDELFTLMEPWGATIRDGFGYLVIGPARPGVRGQGPEPTGGQP